MAEHIPRTITEIQRQYAAGLSPVTIVQECLSRIEATNDSINAMILVRGEEALRDAQALEAELRSGSSRGPLHGIPIAVKDVIDVKGWPTTAASKLFQGSNATENAACVDRLRAAGAVIVGKTNLHELTAGGHENPWYGKVVNPLDASRGTGGTSSGSAAAVAAGYCVAALGTDTGGSNRSTAAATGLFGSKPTTGIIDCSGVRPTAASFDTIGPIARSPEDLLLLHLAMVDAEASSLDIVKLSGLRVGICPDLYSAMVDPAVAHTHAQWLARLKNAGASIVTLPFELSSQVKQAGLTILMYEFAAEYRRKVDATPQNVGDAVHSFLASASTIDVSSYQDALEFRERSRIGFLRLMSGVDVLATPVTPGLAPRLSDEKTAVGSDFVPYGLAGGDFRRWANFFGVPTIAMPLRVPGSLPASIQISTLPDADERLFAICKAMSELETY